MSKRINSKETLRRIQKEDYEEKRKNARWGEDVSLEGVYNNSPANMNSRDKVEERKKAVKSLEEKDRAQRNHLKNTEYFHRAGVGHAEKKSEFVKEET